MLVVAVAGVVVVAAVVGKAAAEIELSGAVDLVEVVEAGMAVVAVVEKQMPNSFEEKDYCSLQEDDFENSCFEEKG